MDKMSLKEKIKGILTTTPEEAKSRRQKVKDLITTTPEEAKSRRGAVKKDLSRAIFGLKKSNIKKPVPKPNQVSPPPSKPKTKNPENFRGSVIKAIKGQDKTTTFKAARPGLDDVVYSVPPKDFKSKNVKNYGGKTKRMMGGGKVYGMKHGGMCKGMGKATRGGKYTVS
jgi:hypothetical protein